MKFNKGLFDFIGYMSFICTPAVLQLREFS